MKTISVERLSQLRYLKREVTLERERILELRAAAGYGRRQEGTRVQASTGDRTGAFAAELAYLDELMAQNMRRCLCELLWLMQFINSVGNSEIRMLLRERYVKGRSWLSAAMRLGYYDEQLARRKIDRFLADYNRAVKNAQASEQTAAQEAKTAAKKTASSPKDAPGKRKEL